MIFGLGERVVVNWVRYAPMPPVLVGQFADLVIVDGVVDGGGLVGFLIG